MDIPDFALRTAIFEWLGHQKRMHGDTIGWHTLRNDFRFKGRLVRLVEMRGINKPAFCEAPISIMTSPDGPYMDRMDAGRWLQYKYRGDSAEHYENRGLKLAMQRRAPLVYFFKISKGWYLSFCPAYVIADDPSTLTFTVAIDDLDAVAGDIGARVAQLSVQDSGADARREYVTTTVKKRLHQEQFRDRVMRAYRERCALCRLRHSELLDAAHIVEDSDAGPPIVQNGLALCKIHHAAFDRFFLGIRPDHIIEIRPDILDEHDGPMLLHGLQGLNLKRIHRPRRKNDWPGAEYLESKYDRFLGSLG